MSNDEKVPAMVLEDGTLLNEGVAILQWIADQAPSSLLAPANGTNARYVLQAKLNYIASEVHPSIAAFFNPSLTAEQKELFVSRTAAKLKWLNDNEVSRDLFFYW